MRDNINHPIIKNVRPEDIEDYTEQFVPFFGREYESDVIKRICIKCDNGEYLFNLISLMEHKSRVDYNVSIQLLKYMVCIWTEYEKSMGEGYKDKVRNKSFRYPPILPIVYYEGSDSWTAGRELRSRIQFADAFEEYIPNFTYELVDIHQISNRELLERKDVMSVIMLLNKIQTPEDFAKFTELERGAFESLLQKTPEQIQDILASVVRTLCARMNATTEEIEKCVDMVRTGKMGYLFENMESMDIQAERRNTAEARAERERAVQEMEQARLKLGEIEEKLGQAEEKLGQTEEVLQQKEMRIRELEELLRKSNIDF